MPSLPKPSLPKPNLPNPRDSLPIFFRQTGQGRNNLPISVNWVSANCPIFLNSFIKQTLGSLYLPSVLKPHVLYRTDGKRSDGVTMTPWEKGKQLVRDVTVVDALAPSRLNQGFLCNPRTTATEAEARKLQK